MFETRTEIRRAARAKAIAKATEKGERRAEKRMKSILSKHGVELPHEVEKELFNNGKGFKK